MDFRSYPSEAIVARGYSGSSKPELVDPRLSDFSVSDEWRVRELLETTGQNSTPSPSPWTMHGTYMAPIMFESFAGQHYPYVSSDSSLSLPYSGADSGYNGFQDRESHRDPSTPGDVGAFSPGNDNDSLYQGEGYVPQLPFNALEAPNAFQQTSGCNAYNPEPYSISSEHESSSSIALYRQTFQPYFHGSSAISSMTDSEVGSPSPSLHPMVNHTVQDTLSTAEEKELASSRKSSPVANRTTRPANKTSKLNQKPGKGQSKVSKPHGKTLHSRAGSKSSKPTTCIQCKIPYQDQAALEKHIKTAHTRPFTCVFHYAGCTSTFATKNEWKRHVSSQHLYLEYYHCDHEECATAKLTSSRRRSKNLPQYGGIFNRKDLFTQHVRRMHQSDEKKKPSRQVEENLKRLQDRALNRRCALPTHMICPAVHCNEQFLGDKAWDDRMEHVARHLERAAAGEEEPVAFGGIHDHTLSAWVESPEVDVVRRCYDGTWKLNNPIKGSNPATDGSDGGAFDEDAEGEDC